MTAPSRPEGLARRSTEDKGLMTGGRRRSLYKVFNFRLVHRRIESLAVTKERTGTIPGLRNRVVYRDL